jgi:hypothetical protein
MNPVGEAAATIDAVAVVRYAAFDESIGNPDVVQAAVHGDAAGRAGRRLCGLNNEAVQIKRHVARGNRDGIARTDADVVGQIVGTALVDRERGDGNGSARLDLRERLHRWFRRAWRREAALGESDTS